MVCGGVPTEEVLMKKLLSLFLIGLILCSLLVGCSDKTMVDPDNPVTLTMWHVYGSQTSSPMNDLIEEFNRTSGKENGVFVKVGLVTNSDDIDLALTAGLNDEPGAYELPDLFVIRESQKSLPTVHCWISAPISARRNCQLIAAISSRRDISTNSFLCCLLRNPAN